MDEKNTHFILGVARNAVSVDGHDLADKVEQEASADDDETTPELVSEMHAVAEVLRALGTTIHPLDWTVEKMALLPALLVVATSAKFDRVLLAERVIIWIEEQASAQVADVVLRGRLEANLAKDMITTEQLHILEAIGKVLRPRMGLPQ
jgi:hypothetical protein